MDGSDAVVVGEHPEQGARHRPHMFDAGLEFPRMVLRWDDLTWNARLMQEYCRSAGADLAPHGKTTMCPDVLRLQLAMGAWGITVASPAQARVAVASGARRLLVANIVVGDSELAALLRLHDDPDVEVITLVDSPEAVATLSGAISSASRPMSVLVEVGMDGGRTGARGLQAVAEVIDAVEAASGRLVLRGIEGYEGVVAPRASDSEARVDRYLAAMRHVATVCRPRIEHPDPIVTAGGSIWVDKVLIGLTLPGYRLIVRSGCYIAHDSGLYDDLSPLSSTGSRFRGGDVLRSAIELWGRVLSTPEAGVAVVGIGDREAPSRTGLPVPQLVRHVDGQVEHVAGLHVMQMFDHHCVVAVPPSLRLSVGTHVGFGISHPCEAFARWRQVVVVDAERRILFTTQTEFE